jgi:hypothetical protein
MKTKTKTVIEVDYHDLNEEIAKFLKSKDLPIGADGFECVVEEEWGNDSDHAFTLEKEQPDEYDMVKMKKGNYQYKVGSILNWMCAEGVLAAGEYLVTVCW